jgi:hypothetical protein
MWTAVLILRIFRSSGAISLSSCPVTAAIVSFVLARLGTLLQHVQQGKLGVVLRCRRDRIVKSPLRILGEIRTERIQLKWFYRDVSAGAFLRLQAAGHEDLGDRHPEKDVPVMHQYPLNQARYGTTP